jgi:homoserine dehydrogenase
LLDLAEGRAGYAFGRPFAQLAAAPRAVPAERGRYYMRLLAEDRPGVVAAVSDRLAHEDISIESFLQMPAPESPVVPIVLTTQTCARKALDAAAKAIEGAGVVAEAPRVWPIEEASARRPWSQR